MTTIHHLPELTDGTAPAALAMRLGNSSVVPLLDQHPHQTGRRSALGPRSLIPPFDACCRSPLRFLRHLLPLVGFFHHGDSPSSIGVRSVVFHGSFVLVDCEHGQHFRQACRHTPPVTRLISLTTHREMPGTFRQFLPGPTRRAQTKIGKIASGASSSI